MSGVGWGGFQSAFVYRDIQCLHELSGDAVEQSHSKEYGSWSEMFRPRGS